MTSDLSKIQAAADAMIAMRAALPDGNVTFDFEEEEIHFDEWQDSGGDPLHLCAMLAPNKNENGLYVASAFNQASRQAQALKVLAEAMELYAEPWSATGGKAAREALAKAAAILEGN